MGSIKSPTQIAWEDSSTGSDDKRKTVCYFFFLLLLLRTWLRMTPLNKIKPGGAHLCLTVTDHHAARCGKGPTSTTPHPILPINSQLVLTSSSICAVNLQFVDSTIYFLFFLKKKIAYQENVIKLVTANWLNWLLFGCLIKCHGVSFVSLIIKLKSNHFCSNK